MLTSRAEGQTGRRSAWWEEFFTGLWLDFQLEAHTDEQTRLEADRIEELLQLPAPERVLDVPCGEGRIAVELAARGYRVTGVDLAEPLLAAARRRADARRLAITWEQRDMRDLPWQDTFVGAFCWWGSFGYFDDDGNRAFLRAVHRALALGGRFLFDVPLAETLLPRLPDRGWRQQGDFYVLVEWRLDHEAGRIDREFTLIRGSTVEKKSISLRLYTYREVNQLLREVGFREVAWYPAQGSGPFRPVAQPPPLVVATK